MKISSHGVISYSIKMSGNTTTACSSLQDNERMGKTKPGQSGMRLLGAKSWKCKNDNLSLIPWRHTEPAWELSQERRGPLTHWHQPMVTLLVSIATGPQRASVSTIWNDKKPGNELYVLKSPTFELFKHKSAIKMTVSYSNHQVHWILIAYLIAEGLSPYISHQREVWTMTFGEEKLAKYKYFTSITAHMGQMPSKNKNSLFQNCFICLAFKMCQLIRTECTALSFEVWKKSEQYNICLEL